jgi:arsenate reductase
MTANRKNILFLCTGNSCRSQMADGWCKALHGDKYNVYSAGTTTHGINPRAVKAMAQAGVDISSHTSKSAESLAGITFEIVFTVCSDADENCPVFPGARVIHVGFDDPPRLTKDMQNEDEIMAVYQRVCGEIRAFVASIPERIER